MAGSAYYTTENELHLPLQRETSCDLKPIQQQKTSEFAHSTIDLVQNLARRGRNRQVSGHIGACAPLGQADSPTQPPFPARTWRGVDEIGR